MSIIIFEREKNILEEKIRGLFNNELSHVYTSMDNLFNYELEVKGEKKKIIDRIYPKKIYKKQVEDVLKKFKDYKDKCNNDSSYYFVDITGKGIVSDWDTISHDYKTPLAYLDTVLRRETAKILYELYYYISEYAKSEIVSDIEKHDHIKIEFELNTLKMYCVSLFEKVESARKQFQDHSSEAFKEKTGVINSINKELEKDTAKTPDD